MADNIDDDDTTTTASTELETSSNTSSDTSSNTMQRYKTVITKQKSTIEELESTVTKLKRLLQMAKRSIEKNKTDLTSKDELIETLKTPSSSSNKTLVPVRISHKIKTHVAVYCLVEGYYHNGGTEDATTTSASSELVEEWKTFSTENDLEQFFLTHNTNGGHEPIVVPSSYSLSPFEVQEKLLSSQQSVEKISEEFRRYRVRAEISRKQQDAALKQQIMQSTSVLQESSSSSSTNTNNNNDSTRLKQEISKLKAAEKKRVDQIRTLEKSVERLQSRAGETDIATEWRERYEAVVAEKNNSTTNNRDETSASKDLEKLKKEYSVYRKRALQVVEEKEMLLVAAQKKLSSAGIHFDMKSAAAANASSNRKSFLINENSNEDFGDDKEGASLNVRKTDTLYLKNVVLNYMCSDQVEVRDHMEKAIATVLKFTPEEVLKVEEKKKNAEAASMPWNLVSGAASSLW